MGRNNNAIENADYGTLTGDAALYAQAFTEEVDKLGYAAKVIGISAVGVVGLVGVLYAIGRTRTPTYL